MIKELPGSVEEGGSEIKAAATMLLGPESHIYRVFRDHLKMPHHKYAHFVATLFLVCRMNHNINKLWDDDDFNTSRYMAPTIFNRVCRLMDEYGLSRNFSSRFWELLEHAFNRTRVEYFTNFQRCSEDADWRFVFTIDDNKLHFRYGQARNVPLGEESRLKRVRHVRDNRLGFNNHVVSYAATNIPIICKFEHEQHTTEMDTFEDIMRTLFNVKGSGKPNLAGQATLVIDRGYFRQAVLKWWLETGGDVLGTVMRGLKFNSFTFGKDNVKDSGSAERPMNVSPDSFRTIHQKTARHNLGRRGTKERALTAMAYCNGISSSVVRISAFLTASKWKNTGGAWAMLSVVIRKILCHKIT